MREDKVEGQIRAASFRGTNTSVLTFTGHSSADSAIHRCRLAVSLRHVAAAPQAFIRPMRTRVTCAARKDLASKRRIQLQGKDTFILRNERLSHLRDGPSLNHLTQQLFI
jgi:hypothetical protein